MSEKPLDTQKLEALAEQLAPVGEFVEAVREDVIPVLPGELALVFRLNGGATLRMPAGDLGPEVTLGAVTSSRHSRRVQIVLEFDRVEIAERVWQLVARAKVGG